jgi:hypothetical protein
MKERNVKAGKFGWWYPQKILEIWVQYMQFVKHCKTASLLLSAGSSGIFEACGTTCTATSSLGGIGRRCFEWGIGVFQNHSVVMNQIQALVVIYIYRISFMMMIGQLLLHALINADQFCLF